MATYEATTSAVTFALMEGETKTVYVVPRTPSFDNVSSGDRIEFDPLGSITIGAVRKYDNLQQLLEAEGLQNVVPDAQSVDDAIASIRATAEWNRKVEDASGVMALRVRTTKRKS
jgi:ASC-1-like (ASCH) protein